ncbi:hypothetical protein ERN12_05875 [Rhodobacteraceae bacterium]|nr:hypothetical protein ERN12_05875 [Paracoccaceae bacterium]
MMDTKGKKEIIPTEELRRKGNVINQTAQQIDPAGLHRVDVNASAQSDMNTKQPGNLPPKTSDDGRRDDGSEEHVIDPKADPPEPRIASPEANPKAVRDAGPEEMKNPPKKWTLEDEESDESFPASDPPGNY